MNNKFKVGDKVRRTEFGSSSYAMYRGKTYVVRAAGPDWIDVEGIKDFGWDPNYFELADPESLKYFVTFNYGPVTQRIPNITSLWSDLEVARTVAENRVKDSDADDECSIWEFDTVANTMRLVEKVERKKTRKEIIHDSVKIIMPEFTSTRHEELTREIDLAMTEAGL